MTRTAPVDGDEPEDLHERLTAAAARGQRRPNASGPAVAASPARKKRLPARDEVSPRGLSANGDGSNPADGSPEQQEFIKKVAAGLRRPVLVPDVELHGQMQESAFKDPPYQIARAGKFIQVSELLYHVAEQIDGQRGLDDIARRVSEDSGRKVTTGNAQHLVGNLMKLGIVAVPGVNDEGEADEEEGYRARSPLAINMRVAMIGPGAIEPLTRFFQYLYWPPIVLAVVLVSAVVQAWLFFVHGAGGSFHEAFYTPTLFLAALGMVVLSAAFHEFGHAAALKYGGGRVGGMGAGVYIVYPAFFTDVTDNYRLPRWSRVRTDVGGFYFNLLFALGIMTAYALTGEEFLLLVVVLVDLQILQQMIPFVRLDGYWTLADITGFPDFFSQIGAFLRSLLPSWLPLGEGRELPELKTWAKFFFLGYLLLTIPLLIFLLFMLVLGVPRIIATAFDSIGQQADKLSDSFGSSDWLGVLSAVAQMLILALPIGAIIYTLGFNLGRRAVQGVWNWSKRGPLHALSGSLGTIAFLAFVAYLWAPNLPSGLGGDAGGPLYRQTSFDPIGENERFAVGDVLQDERRPQDEDRPIDPQNDETQEEAAKEEESAADDNEEGTIDDAEDEEGSEEEGPAAEEEPAPADGQDGSTGPPAPGPETTPTAAEGTPSPTPTP